ncbi:class II aldolase/adducin family protein [Flaviflexus massiliensis]|uniref:class II aldolase/adducin family protein n=1 Tax=Flaviflexus massiliensis TaxID=1522309 RepID=UPI00097D5B3B|nr:class II aldolase/adducin family protein [Flaviflexus massiliensis]
MNEQVQEMLNTAHRLAALGLSPGTSGNISCRVGETIYLSGSGTSFSTLSESDLTILNNGHVEGASPTKEMGFHLKVYERNPEATAVIHVHSPNATAVSCLDPWQPYFAIPPITPYVFMRVGNLPYVPYEHPGSPELFDSIDKVEYPYDALLLANHGVITSGTLAQAEQACIEIESLSGLHLQLLGHNPNRLTEEQCEQLAKKAKRPWNRTDYRKT